MLAWNKLGYQIDPAMLQIKQVEKLQFEDIVGFYEKYIKDKPMKVLIMGDPKLIDQKVLKARFGKVNKLNTNKIFSE